MFALVASIILFLRAFGVIDNSADIDWFMVGLGFWALHFAVTVGLPIRINRDNTTA